MAGSDVHILILDDDEDSQLALRHILDSEGWRVKVVPRMSRGLAELASGEWTLVIVNAALTDVQGSTFEIFRDLAQADVASETRKRVRVLFLVPMRIGKLVQPELERQQLPYLLKPYHLHDLLQKVSDLLMEAEAIPRPIRRTKLLASKDLRPKERSPGKHGREVSMFASRKDYQMTEEEILEYEREEEEARKKKQKKEKDLERI